MYNRYIPQADGSYQKKRMSEPKRNEQIKKSPHPPPVPCPSAPESALKKERPRQTTPCKYAKHEHESIGGFFKNLLPKDMDTGDLMIILLLLLMAGDCEEDKNTALLTLALYFFM